MQYGVIFAIALAEYLPEFNYIVFFFYVFFATVFAWPGECPDNRQVHLVCVVLELNATTVANNTLSFFLSLSLFDSLCLSCFPRLKVR